MEQSPGLGFLLLQCNHQSTRMCSLSTSVYMLEQLCAGCFSHCITTGIRSLHMLKFVISLLLLVMFDVQKEPACISWLILWKFFLSPFSINMQWVHCEIYHENLHHLHLHSPTLVCVLFCLCSTMDKCPPFTQNDLSGKLCFLNRIQNCYVCNKLSNFLKQT